MKDDSRGGVFS
jgi:hypothetical protein